MARPKKSSDEGGGANWMDTYGDMVTLLLCFFVLLFSFSTIDAKKWEQLVGAFSGAQPITIQGLTMEQVMSNPIPEYGRYDQPEDSENEEEDLNAAEANVLELYISLSNYVEANSVSATVDLDEGGYKVIVRFAEDILFNSGEAELLPEAYPVLDHIIEAITLSERLIEVVNVEGHTDNVPVISNNGRFADNMDLSAIRATAAARYIMNSGFDIHKLRYTGFGEWFPIDTNTTEEGRSNNRRVDFVIEALKKQVQGVG